MNVKRSSEVFYQKELINDIRPSGVASQRYKTLKKDLSTV